MDKQQAAEEYANKHYGLLKDDIDRIGWHTAFAQIIAGWEAHSALQTARPVWVNTVDRNPPVDYKGDMRYIKHCEDGPWYSQWLDESQSAPALFTREQVEEIAAKWSITLLDIKDGKIPHIGNGHDFSIWFNDNYPTTK